VLWRREDPRPAKDLLEFALHHGQDKELEKDEAWQDAFHAPLGKGGNFGRALAARQQAIFESGFYAVRPLFWRAGENADVTAGNPQMQPPTIGLRAPVVDVDGHGYLLILAIETMFVSPGHG
jgi:hypothetical protein